MPSPSEPAFIHAVDQIGAALRDMAPALRSFFDSCRAEGFTPEESLALTQQALDSLIQRGKAAHRERKRE